LESQSARSDLLQRAGRANLCSIRDEEDRVDPRRTVESIKAGLDKGELPTQEIGAMCYMLSKDGYLGDPVQHWHPHVMFFLPQVKAEAWGAGLAGSPILAGLDPEDRLTVFLIPVGKWSDGTPDAGAGH
jgi:hypothetical protein